MKKVFLSILTLVLSINMFAITYTDKASITLYDGTYYPHLVAGESADIAVNTLENGYYAPINDLENQPIAIYAIYNGTNYSNLILNNLVNIPMGIKTSSATTYWLHCSDVTGTLKIYDTKTSTEYTANATTPYEFTIESTECNSYINDRFYFFYDNTVVTSVTTNEEGWASFAYSADVKPVDANLVMYRGVVSGDALNLYNDFDGIAAGKGVIVKGTANTIYNFIAASAPAMGENSLIGCPDAATAAAGTNFVLSYQNSVTAFYQYTGTTIPAGKAYLNFPAASPAPKRIRMVVGEAQGVENVEAEAQAEKFVENGQVYIRRGNEVYNLQGQIVK